MGCSASRFSSARKGGVTWQVLCRCFLRIIRPHVTKVISMRIPKPVEQLMIIMIVRWLRNRGFIGGGGGVELVGWIGVVTGVMIVVGVLIVVLGVPGMIEVVEAVGNNDIVGVIEVVEVVGNDEVEWGG